MAKFPRLVFIVPTALPAWVYADVDPKCVATMSSLQFAPALFLDLRHHVLGWHNFEKLHVRMRAVLSDEALGLIVQTAQPGSVVPLIHGLSSRFGKSFVGFERVVDEDEIGPAAG